MMRGNSRSIPGNHWIVSVSLCRAFLSFNHSFARGASEEREDEKQGAGKS
eukprot:gene8369-5858_t